MKKLSVLLILVFCLLAMLCACGGNGTTESTAPSDNTVQNDSTGDTGNQDATDNTQDTGNVAADPTYEVTVLDQNGDPVQGAMLQFCDDTSCKMPEMTNAEGKISKSYPESNYHVTVTAPDGYSCDTAEFYFAEGETTLTITLTKN